MTIGANSPIPSTGAPLPTSDDKRLQLQTLLLRKTLDMQQQEAEAAANEAIGKGRLVDLRV